MVQRTAQTLLSSSASQAQTFESLRTSLTLQTSFIISKFAQKKAWGQLSTALIRSGSFLARDEAPEDEDNVDQILGCSNPCNRSFLQSYGIPCYHMIQEMLDGQLEVGPELFHKQWWLVRKEDLVRKAEERDKVMGRGDVNQINDTSLNFHAILNPPAINVRGRPIPTQSVIVIQENIPTTQQNHKSQIPRHVGANRSTQRLPSQFERVEGAPRPARKPREPRKCSLCRQPGHVMTICVLNPNRRVPRGQQTDHDAIQSIDQDLAL